MFLTNISYDCFKDLVFDDSVQHTDCPLAALIHVISAMNDANFQKVIDSDSTTTQDSGDKDNSSDFRSCFHRTTSDTRKDHVSLLHEDAFVSLMTFEG